MSSDYTKYAHYAYHHYTTLCDESIRSPFRFYIFAHINNTYKQVTMKSLYLFIMEAAHIDFIILGGHSIANP